MLGLARWVVRGVRRPATQSGGPSCRSDNGVPQSLPPGLAEALPSVSVSVLSGAVIQVKAGQRDLDLVRRFGLALREAKVITAYADDGQ